MKRAILFGILGLFFLSGCGALFGTPASQQEAFVYTYEDAGFHMQLAKEIIISLKTSGDLTPEQFTAARETYNEAVDLYQEAGNAYKSYLTAPDPPAALTARQKYRALMLELTKLILKVNEQLKKGGKQT